MGFLIFAYRKLFLKRKINDLNFQAMMLSEKKQRITDQIGQTQQAMSSAKNMINIFTSSSIAYKQTEDMSKYYEYVQDPKNSNIKTLKPKEGVNVSDIAYSSQIANAGIMAASNACNSIFDAVSTAQLNILNAEDSQISLQLANIDSQTKQLMPELESVEKAEDQAAKSEAPKFGLS